MRERAGFTTALAISGLVMVLFLGIVLAYILLNQALGPIRRLAVYYDGRKSLGIEGNEVKALSQSFENLIHDVDLTRTKFELSQERLVQAEKWALVRKLAAGLAHSVRVNHLHLLKCACFPWNEH